MRNDAEDLQPLRTWNIALGVLHGAQAIAACAVSFSGPDLFAPITTQFLRPPPPPHAGGPPPMDPPPGGDVPVDPLAAALDPPRGPMIQDFRQVGTLRVGALASLFFAVTALFHLYLGTIGRGGYERRLKADGSNPARWIEYSFTCSLMWVLIAALTGISDASFLACIFTLSACMNLFGLVFEQVNASGAAPQARRSAERATLLPSGGVWVPPSYERDAPAAGAGDEVDWWPYIYGFLAFGAGWGAIGAHFFGALTNASSSVPAFVYGIFFSLSAMMLLFPLNQFLQYARIGPWARDVFAEQGYMVLSLVAKTLLTWQIVGGARNSRIDG